MQAIVRPAQNERTTEIDQFRLNSQLGTKMNGRQRELESMTKGSPLGRMFSPTAGNPLYSGLEAFRTRNTSPLDDEVFQMSEQESQTILPVNRIAKQIAASYDAVGRYELAILFKNNESNLNTMRLPEENTIVQCNPLNIITPEIFNYIEARKQHHLFDNKYDEYMALTPNDIWKDYVFDGIVEAEMMLGGGESFTTSGFVQIPGQQPLHQRGNGNKRLTMDAKGSQYVFNYFGENIREGGSCYAIIKKFRGAEIDYKLTNKRNIAALTSHKCLDISTTSPFRPYQMTFICLPQGGPVPSEALMYQDERGDKRYDGLAIYLGVLFSVPQDHQYKEVDVVNTRPFTGLSPGGNNTHVLNTPAIMLPKLILDPRI